LHSDVNAILLAMRGHVNMLRMIHGGSDENVPPWLAKQRATLAKQLQDSQRPKARVMTPDAFDTMFGGKNTRSRAKIKR